MGRIINVVALGLIVLIVIVIVLVESPPPAPPTSTSSSPSPTGSQPPKPRTPTFAFYYPWYGTPAVSYWHHWNDSSHNPNNIVNGKKDIPATDYPLQDVYDSNNETVIRQQIILARNAGINCFIISWWGINSFEDNASIHIMKVCEEENFLFTFYLENTSETYDNSPSVNQTVNDLTYLLNTYGSSLSFYKVDGRPVIFVYKSARDNLNPQGWIWHACTDSIGIDESPNAAADAGIQWLPAEEIRVPPRLGIIPFQPFKLTKGYVESGSSIYLSPNEQYSLKVGVSDIRNDSGVQSHVGVKIMVGLDSLCNDTLNDAVLNFSDGWQDWSFNITHYAGKSVYIKAESYAVNWSSEWAALDYLYIVNSRGEIVSQDPFFDNGWEELMHELGVKGVNPFVILDFGGFEGKIRSFVDYFEEYFDGIHVYNPIGLLNGSFLNICDLYSEASSLVHFHNKTFIATVMPGFDVTVASNNSSDSRNVLVERKNGETYNSFWQMANASSPDGYVITSFNEWHEGTEIELSVEYMDRYLNLTFEFVNRYNVIPTQVPTQTPTPAQT